MLPRSDGQPIVHTKAEVENAKVKNCPLVGAVGALLHAPGGAVPDAQSNQGVHGTTRGSQPATPRVQLSRRRAEVRGAQPTACGYRGDVPRCAEHNLRQWGLGRGARLGI